MKENNKMFGFLKKVCEKAVGGVKAVGHAIAGYGKSIVHGIKNEGFFTTIIPQKTFSQWSTSLESKSQTSRILTKRESTDKK